MHISWVRSPELIALVLCLSFTLLSAVSVQSPHTHASVTPLLKTRLPSPSLLLVSTICGDTHVLRARDGSGAQHRFVVFFDFTSLSCNPAFVFLRVVDPSGCQSFGVNLPARKFLRVQAGACSGRLVPQHFGQVLLPFHVLLGNLFRVDGDRGLVERLPRSVQVLVLGAMSS
jgi:hypothetical protein